MKSSMLVIFCTLNLFVALVYAQQETPASNELDHAKSSVPEDLAATLTNDIAEQVIIPLFVDFYSNILILDKKISAFCQDPEFDKLEKAQKQWQQTMTNWSSLAFFNLEPASIMSLPPKIFFPRVIYKQISALSEKLAASPESSSVKPGIAASGLKTLEYLLFDKYLPTNEILELYKRDTDSRRCNYLSFISDKLTRNAKQVTDIWLNDQPIIEKYLGQYDFQPTYQDAFVELTQAINTELSAIVLKLSHPTGYRRTRPRPFKAENWHSRTSLDQIINALTLLKQLIDPQLSIYNYGKVISELGHKTAVNEANDKLDQLIETLNSIQPNLYDAINENPSAPRKAAKQVSDFVHSDYRSFLKPLGITRGFRDNDGDW